MRITESQLRSIVRRVIKEEWKPGEQEKFYAWQEKQLFVDSITSQMHTFMTLSGWPYPIRPEVIMQNVDKLTTYTSQEVYGTPEIPNEVKSTYFKSDFKPDSPYFIIAGKENVIVVEAHPKGIIYQWKPIKLAKQYTDAIAQKEADHLAKLRRRKKAQEDYAVQTAKLDPKTIKNLKGYANSDPNSNVPDRVWNRLVKVDQMGGTLLEFVLTNAGLNEKEVRDILDQIEEFAGRT
jgi:hypothetical protein